MRLGEFLEKFDSILKAEDPSVRRIPILIIGPPGIGKTAGIRHVAESNGYKFYQEILSRKRPEHLEGIMVPTSISNYEGSRVAKMVATDLYKKAVSADKVVILLDELTTAPPSILNAALTILTDFVISGKELKNDVVFVAAGNDASSGVAYVSPIRASVSTRFLNLVVEPDLEYLKRHRLLEKIYAPVVGAFLLRYPEWFYNPATYDVVGDTTAQQITTPRGWERLSILIRNKVVSPTSEISQATIYGTIGLATEPFIGFWKKFEAALTEYLNTGKLDDDITPWVQYMDIKPKKKTTGGD